jgi:hypothetical protein
MRSRSTGSNAEFIYRLAKSEVLGLSFSISEAAHPAVKQSNLFPEGNRVKHL